MLCLTDLYSVYILPRHCEKRSEGMRTTKPVKVLFKGNERRGNLPSLMNWREVFQMFVKITAQRTQCEEIAEEPLAGGSISLLAWFSDDSMIRSAKGFSSQMQQCSAFFVSFSPKLRLAMTKCSDVFRSGQCEGLNVHVMKGGV
jgi:hypothetical protein